MPRVKPGERKRAKRPKTRTGCRTCKVRRVKCDEAKPYCSRCTSTGRNCEGYEYHEDAGNSVSTIKSVALSSAFRTADEQRAFRFFCERTTWELSGFYDCEFWNRIVLQAAHADPGIRHAVTALSSLHERFESTGEVTTFPGDFALKQYNLAITKHLDTLTKPDKKAQSVDTYLASCMIFICIELLQGHFVSASQLIQGALQLLYETHPGVKPTSEWPLEVFEALLCRLQTQCVGLFGSAARPKVYAPRFMSVAHIEIPQTFESIAQARDFLDFYSWHFALPDPSSDSSERRGFDSKNAAFYMSVQNKWSTAFESLLASLGPNLSKQEQGATKILKMRQYMAALNIDLSFRYAHRNDEEGLWESYHSIFSDIIDMAEEVAQLSESPDRMQKMNTFTLDFGLVSPMYDVARICRDPIIRRKAIDILCANPCREGLWDGVVAARIAERVMLLEEAALPRVEKASDIPASARVSLIVPTFISDSNGPVVSYVNQSDPSEGTTVREMVGLKPVDEFGRTVLTARSRSSPSSTSSTPPK